MLPDLMERQSDGTRCAIGAGIKGALAGLVCPSEIVAYSSVISAVRSTSS